MAMKGRFLIHHPKDNVAVILSESMKKGDTIEIGSRTIPLRASIPFGHKVAIRDIPKGDYAVKYGQKIGKAKRDIHPGEHVHGHNLEDVVDELRAEALNEARIEIEDRRGKAS